MRKGCRQCCHIWGNSHLGVYSLCRSSHCWMHSSCPCPLSFLSPLTVQLCQRRGKRAVNHPPCLWVRGAPLPLGPQQRRPLAGVGYCRGSSGRLWGGQWGAESSWCRWESRKQIVEVHWMLAISLPYIFAFFHCRSPSEDAPLNTFNRIYCSLDVLTH